MHQIFRSEALQAQSESAPGNLLRPTPGYLRWWVGMTLLLTPMLAIFVLNSSYSSRQTVSGFISPGAGMIRVVPLRAGRVSAVAASPRRPVTAGDLLFTIDTDQGNEAVWRVQQQSARTQRDAALADLRLRHSLTRDQSQALEQQLTDARQRSALWLQQQLDASRQLELTAQRLERRRQARQRDLISPDNLAQHESGWLAARMALREITLQLASSRQREAELEAQAAQLELEAQQVLAAAEARLAEARMTLRELTSRHQVAVRAPVSGTLQSVAIQVGQVVGPGDLLASIWPAASPLEARLIVPTRAAGQLHVGQTVWLRLAAFPYQRYGLQPARIVSIAGALVEPAELPSGVNLVEPSFRVTAHLSLADAGAIPRPMALRPGMTLEAELVRDRGRVYQWLVKPLRERRT